MQDLNISILCECQYCPLLGISELCFQIRCLQFDKHLTLTKTIILLEKKKKFTHTFSFSYQSRKPDPPSGIPGLYQSNHRVSWSISPLKTLPDGALDTCPDWALESLCSSYVVPVQTSVGDLVLGLWVRSCPVFRTRHHHRQWGSLRLKLDDVELLPVGQRLVGFLQGGRRQEVRKKRDVAEAPNSAGQLLIYIFLMYSTFSKLLKRERVVLSK